jgi:superfamily II DNA or RNA helicase
VKRAVAGVQDYLRKGNHVYSALPLPPRIRETLEGGLTFIFRNAVRRGRKITRIDEPTRLFDFTDDGRIAFTYGLWRRTRRLLKTEGIEARLIRLDDYNPEVHRAQWNRIAEDPDPDRTQAEREPGDPYRYRQYDVLRAIERHWTGCIDMPVGGGKGFIIRQICMLYPNAKIDVVVRGNDVLLQRLYPEISAYVRSVGVVGGGTRELGSRVTLFSADSLHHSRCDADILLVDEVHEIAADKSAEMLSRYLHSRNYGFSGSHNLRNDNKDVRVEALFGPIIFQMTYQEGVDAGLVVPVEVHWEPLDYEGFDDRNYHSDTAFWRRAVWRNPIRNRHITDDARAMGDKVQRLVAVKTVEHALFLKKLLPEFELIYGVQGDRDKLSLLVSQLGLDEDGWTWLDRDRKDEIAEDFRLGKIKAAIATGVWKKGVDFPQLSAVIRAEAVAIPIDDVQYPGRASRIYSGKRCAIIRDYTDRFSVRLARNARRRHDTYDRLEWAQRGWER